MPSIKTQCNLSICARHRIIMYSYKYELDFHAVLHELDVRPYMYIHCSTAIDFVLSKDKYTCSTFIVWNETSSFFNYVTYSRHVEGYRKSFQMKRWFTPWNFRVCFQCWYRHSRYFCWNFVDIFTKNMNAFLRLKVLYSEEHMLLINEIKEPI